MMMEEQFIELLKESEGPSVDFKRDLYDLTHIEGKGAFVKDVISMANTPRIRPAFIVLGVKSYPNGKKEIRCDTIPIHLSLLDPLVLAAPGAACAF